MAGTILKSIGSTAQSDGTAVTGSNTNLTGVSIGSGNTFAFQSAAVMGGSVGYRLNQGGANQITSYLDLASAVTGVFAWRRVFRYATTPAASTTVFRFYPDTGHATNLGSVLFTTTNRYQFVEGGSGSPLSVTSTGTALTPGNTYVELGKIDLAANTLDAKVYPYGSTSQVFAVTGTLGADMASAAGIQSVRIGINTASSGMGNFDLNDTLAIGSGDWLARTDVANVAPTANAGVDQTADPGATVTLTGSGTDTDGTIASYAWAQTSGTTVTLTGTGASRTFTAPITTTGATLLFQLTVTDDQAATGTDTIQVTVTPAEGRLHDGSSVKGSAGLLTT